MKSKGDILNIFKGFYVAIEREIGKLLKCLRSDNGGKYSSIDFDDYYSKHDIRYKNTVPYSHQLNGIVKKMNRTLTEWIRSTLSTTKLPKT